MSEESSTGAAAATSSTSALRILVVVTSNRARGAEIEADQLAARLTTEGHEVRVAALAHDPEHTVTTAEPLGTRRLSWATLRALRRRASDADVVVAYGSSTLPACAMALARSGVPFVYRSIGDPARWVNGRLHRARTGILFRRAAHVVPLWEGAGADIAELYGVSPDRITAIANARNPDQFRPATQPERTALRADFDIAPGELVVLVLGALEPEKRVALAIRTIASRPTMRLFIVGDGSERPQLERLAAAIAPDQVTFLGHVADPVRLLRSIDALILTSSTEGMPGVVLEAGLSEIPVVSTNVGMIDRLVVNGITGVVVDDPTVESLADGLDRCLAHRLDMGPAARAHLLGGYSWDAVIPQWGVLLGQVRGSGR